MGDAPFHDECARGEHDWCGCSWCYVHSSCPGSIKSGVFKNGHWQRCSPSLGKESLASPQVSVLDGIWTDKYKKGKHKHIYTIVRGKVDKDGVKKRDIEIIRGEILTLLKHGKKGKHRGKVPKDEIHWDDDDTDTWIRLEDGDKDGEDDKGGEKLGDKDGDKDGEDDKGGEKLGDMDGDKDGEDDKGGEKLGGKDGDKDGEDDKGGEKL